MARTTHHHPLELRSVERGPVEDEADVLRLHTNAGAIETRYHAADSGDVAVLWVFGAGGGLGGPAGGLYPRLAERLVPHGVASLRMDYRRPGDLSACVLDALVGIGYLRTRGRTRAVLVGHSFGGAVAISAGVESADVVAVAALSSQTAGALHIADLSPRPVLLMHGTADEVLPDRCSRHLYSLAREPRQIILYPGCRHGLDQCRDAVDRDLFAWLLAQARREGDVLPYAAARSSMP
jgi:hypothetical protein